MAAVITPVKQNSLIQRPKSRSTGKRQFGGLMQTTPEQQGQRSRSTATNSIHNNINNLAPALSISSRKRTREVHNNTDHPALGAAAVPAAVPLLDENSDLIRNGRALFAATTTSLGAPLDIPNKRRRTAAADPELAAVVAQPFAHPNAAVLATPNRTSAANTSVLNAGGSKKLSSRKKGSAGKQSVTDKSKTAATAAAATVGVERRVQQEEAAADWEKKYRKAFKTFVFYFDGLEDGKRKEGERAVRELGAKSDSFFSKGVTHVVTSRPIPSGTAPTLPSINSAIASKNNAIFLAPGGGKENVTLPPIQKRGDSESPVKQSAGLNGSISKQQDSLVGPNRRTRARIGVTAANNSVIPMRTPPKLKAFADSADSQDILVKALSFQMKIWTVEKLQKMLARLLDPQSPSKVFLYPAQQHHPVLGNAAGYQFNFQGAGAPAKPSLPSLLRAEQLTGSTYERDLNTVRPDHHYFSSKNGYLLVEDSSGEHQPAHAKEYEQRVIPRVGDEEHRETEWPTLWGGQEGRGAFFKPAANYIPPLPNLILDEPKKIAATFLSAPSNAPSLRRSVSMNALRSRHATNGNGQAQQQQPTVNLDSYQAASGNSQIITSNIASGTSTTTTRSGHVIGGAGAGGVGGKNSLAEGIIVDKRLARLGSKAKKHIVTLGRNTHVVNKENVAIGVAAAAARLPAMKRSISMDNVKSMRAAREEVKKPGYCENCRVRYEDFKTHTRSRKHRKFALDPSNWEDLDALLANISRPVNTELLELYEAAGCDVPSDVERSDDEDEDDLSNNGEGEDSEMENDDSGYASRSDYEDLAAHVRGGAGGAGQVSRKLWKKRPVSVADEEDLGDEDTGDDDEDDQEESDSAEASTSEEEEALESQSGSAASDGDKEEDGDDEEEDACF